VICEDIIFGIDEDLIEPALIQHGFSDIHNINADRLNGSIYRTKRWALD
jgi:hypothetical protein